MTGRKWSTLDIAYLPPFDPPYPLKYLRPKDQGYFSFVLKMKCIIQKRETYLFECNKNNIAQSFQNETAVQV